MTLMSREQSSMASTWNELLCLNKIGNRKWSIGVYSYNVLGSIYDLVPEDKLYDEDGELIVHDEWEGKKVLGLEGGEYLQTDELVLREEGVEFDASSLHVDRDYCLEHRWDHYEEFRVAWEKLDTLVAGLSLD
jgi:hypothetical protein